MSNIRMSGSPVVPVCRGEYVSEVNPLPVEVIGGGVELPRESSGVLSCNLNSVSSGISVPVEVSNSSLNVNITNSTLNTLGGLYRANVLVAQAVMLSQGDSNFTSFYNQAYSGEFSGENYFVRLLGVYSGGSGGVYTFQYPDGSKAVFSCGTVVDILGSMSGTPSASAGFGQAGSWNSGGSTVFLNYWCYTVS